jgi:hypothetical protein
MCRIRAAMDPQAAEEVASSAAALAARGASADAYAELAELVRRKAYTYPLELLKELMAQKPDAAAVYTAVRGYLFPAYIQAVADRLADEIERYPMYNGYYYADFRCCTALSELKAVLRPLLYMHDELAAYFNAITYDPPCLVPLVSVQALRAVAAFFYAEALKASI